jgi:hypothetical protein
MERIFIVAPSCTFVSTELGYLFILQSQVKEARMWYSEAMQMEENRMAALTGLCRLGRERVGGQTKCPLWVPKRSAKKHFP